MFFFFCQTTLICFFLRKYSIGFGEAALNPTGRKCPDPNGVDKKAACYSYCKTQGFMGGSCQGHKGNYMCKCYEGIWIPIAWHLRRQSLLRTLANKIPKTINGERENKRFLTF